jgi:chaperone modulatory protein CbpM
MTGVRIRHRPWLSPPVARARLQGERWLSRAELATAAGITRERLERLIRLGLVDPVPGGPEEFTAETLLRLQRMLRLNADLGVNLIGAAIIADLLERLDRLEAELARRRGGGP